MQWKKGFLSAIRRGRRGFLVQSGGIFAMEARRIPTSLPAGAHPPAQLLPPNMPPTSSLWQGAQLQQYLKGLLENIDLLKAITAELDVIALMKRTGEVTKTCNIDNLEHISGTPSVLEGDFVDSRSDLDSLGKDQTSVLQSLLEVMKNKNADLDAQQCMALEAGKFVESILKNQLFPLDTVINQTGRWEERAAAVRLADKQLKIKRNRQWRKRKRQLAAETRCKELERYEQADQEADEWRAREIAKDIARRKVEKMKEIAKVKAKEEKQRLESELELVLIVEKLQELRSIRIEKLKKQGHFLPDEDNKFLERVQAAVEEEERQAAAAADTRAATNAIANAEESRKAVGTIGTETCKEEPSNLDKRNTTKENISGSDSQAPGKLDAEPADERNHEPEGNKSGVDDTSYTLPPEFYHYYHGSNADLGTLIEVRRTWDAFIMPGGSRIPPHWVQPPPPADEFWASYVVKKEEITKNQHKCKRREREDS